MDFAGKRAAFVCLVLGIVVASAFSADPTPMATAVALPDLSAYKTVDTAAQTTIVKSKYRLTGQPGYLGVLLNPDAYDKLIIDGVEAASPAETAGLKAGDVVLRINDRPVAHRDEFQQLLLATPVGEEIKLALQREEKPVNVSVKLAAISRPMRAGQQRTILGVQVGEPKPGIEGLPIESVAPDGPAAKAKLKVGEVILKIDGVPMTSSGKLRELISAKKPEDNVTLTLLVAEKTVDLKVTLGEEEVGSTFGGWDFRGAGGIFKKPAYKLAVVCIEFSDTKHNAKIATKDWEEALFSKGTYGNKKNVTGQPVHGSVHDYYLEQSCGALRVEGKIFEWVEAKKKRTEYGQTRNRFELLTEALDAILARDGKEALKDFDGIFFMYAGGRVAANRGGLYWPHRAFMSHQKKRWDYFICPEGGERMADISVTCHEFGHMLGLPDLYARPENPGSEGIGAWCAMSEQRGQGRPQHFSAWCKEQLGWLKPVVIDPAVKQKLILSPVEGSSKECFKVLAKRDGSEYFLLENRKKVQFDSDLPAEGLLIWRVINNKVFLEESHGVEGPPGPRVHAASVPFPSGANSSFTPLTTPSSRSQLGGGLPVHITNIRRLPDGRITFHIGYQYF